MADQAVEAKRLRRLAECSYKAKLDTGKFKPGSLSERVREILFTFVACLFWYRFSRQVDSTTKGEGGGGIWVTSNRP